jgi:hypothetical protein
MKVAVRSTDLTKPASESFLLIDREIMLIPRKHQLAVDE